LNRESTFVTCHGCGRKVYRTISRCPDCRRRMRLTDSDWRKIFVTVALLLVSLALIWMMAINSEM
jgi:predicted ATP-dependent serine protease